MVAAARPGSRTACPEDARGAAGPTGEFEFSSAPPDAWPRRECSGGGGRPDSLLNSAHGPSRRNPYAELGGRFGASADPTSPISIGPILGNAARSPDRRTDDLMQDNRRARSAANRNRAPHRRAENCCRTRLRICQPQDDIGPRRRGAAHFEPQRDAGRSPGTPMTRAARDPKERKNSTALSASPELGRLEIRTGHSMSGIAGEDQMPP